MDYLFHAFDHAGPFRLHTNLPSCASGPAAPTSQLLSAAAASAGAGATACWRVPLAALGTPPHSAMLFEGTQMDPYAVNHDIARRLSDLRPSNSEDAISQLRALQLPDDWWMYSFKVTPCARSYSHKWTLCPCAHAGETARRRDPRTHPYKAVLCPLAKMKKPCPMGDACAWSHNVFEHWLHPSRFKTRLCSFGRSCNRPICFFAHDAIELRTAPPVDENADLDEREYLVHLMASQQASGMGMGGMGMQMGASGMGGHGTMRMSNNGGPMGMPMLDLMGSGMGAMGGGGGGAHMPHMQRQHSAQLGNASSQHSQRHMNPPARAASARDMSAAVAAAAAAGLHRAASTQLPPTSGHGVPPQAPLPQRQGGAGLDAASLLLGLQESLASLGGLPMEGPWTGVPGLAGAGAHSRISDPGSGAAEHMNHVRNLTRMSDSGQGLSLAGARGLAGLESLLTSALAGAISHPGTSASSPLSAHSPSASLALVHGSSGVHLPPQGGTTGRPASSDSVGSSGSSSSPASSPPPSARPVAPGGDPSPRAGRASAPGDGVNTGEASVQQLIAQLQAQGVVTSKEQLVASLTQLLAQLLVTS